MTDREAAERRKMSIGTLSAKKWQRTYQEFPEASARTENFSQQWLEAVTAKQKEMKEEGSERSNEEEIKSELLPFQTGITRVPFRHLKENTYGNPYFWLKNEMGVIEYKGAVFYCDEKTNALMLGDCTNRSDCITISLAEGGSLVVNRKNVGELLDAITMFSPEDRRRIIEAIQQDRMAQQALRELEETKDSAVEILQ